jgi:hypothetical protein
MRRRSSLALRCIRLGTVAAVAGALVAVPSAASADTPTATWQPPASHVVILNPPFSVDDVRSNPKAYAPRDGSAAAYVYTTPGTQTVLQMLNTVYPGLSAGLPAGQVAVYANTKASQDSTVQMIAKAPLPRIGEAGTLPTIDPPGINGDVCADENQCAYYLVTMWATKPSGGFNHHIETRQETQLAEDDGGVPTADHTALVFKDSQGENWSGSFFRSPGYYSQGFGYDADPGVHNYYVDSYGYGDLPQFDQGPGFGPISFPILRSSSNITSGNCVTITQSYPWRAPEVTKTAAVMQDTYGLSGWNTNPFDNSSPNDSKGKTFLAPCEQLQYL